MRHLSYLILAFLAFSAQATQCPDPETTSLKWGVPPAPWVVNPYSANSPQADEQTSFVRANILVAGYGRGVVCTYKNTLGEYSIWWEVLTKVPARTESQWIENFGGFVCVQWLESCEFSVAAPT
ncbi:MAG: DUF3757 domain-containing protein [Legionella sp.]|nr:MAG: DUF3757 domain-containing protein [Legionella sp.]